MRPFLAELVLAGQPISSVACHDVAAGGFGGEAPAANPNRDGEAVIVLSIDVVLLLAFQLTLSVDVSSRQCFGRMRRVSPA